MAPRWGYTSRRVMTLEFSLASLLKRKLGELSDPELRMMLDVSSADYLNYVKVRRGLIGLPDSTETAIFLVEEAFENSPVETVKDLSEWLDLWIVKWRQRVRLVLTPSRTDAEARKIEGLASSVYAKLPFISELKDLTVGSLIEVGEVCFTNFLAESMIKNSLAKMLRDAGSERRLLNVLKDNPFVLLDEVLRQVKKLRHYKGPLVTVWVGSVLRENMLWRYPTY